MGLLSDHHNKENIKASHTNVLFPRAYKSYVYPILQSVKCATALCVRNNAHTVIKYTLLL